MENGDTERFADVTSFGFLDDKGDWIKLVRQNELPDSLKKKKGTKADFDVVLYHPLKKDSVCFRHLSMNRDCPDGKGVLLRSKEGWRYHNPAEGKTYPLPLGEEHDISLVNFSKQGNLLACLYKPSKEKEQRILIYNLAKQCLIDSLSSASGHLPEGFEPTAGRLSFSADGKSLFFRIQKKAEIKKPAEKPATPAKPAVVIKYGGGTTLRTSLLCDRFRNASPISVR